MLLCIAGKNDIAVQCLAHIIENYPSIDKCVCLNKNDDGVDGWQKSLRKYAWINHIEIIALSDLFNEKDLIFISLEYDQIISVDKFKSKRLYNIHFSLLPQYRGMYTASWPILNNESWTGVTLHKIDQGIDTGEIIDQQMIRIDITDTARDVYLKCIQAGNEVFRRNIDLLISMTYTIHPQDKWRASYYSKKSIDYADTEVDFINPAISVYNKVRAYSFKEYQMPTYKGAEVISCKILDQQSKGKAGQIIAQDKLRIIITTMDYNVEIIVADNIDECEL